jgi:aminomethyltransferase
MLKKTPLNAVHHSCGARMVDFGGWEMPLHYGSQIEEHHAVRRDAGVFDVSHMLAVDLSGADAKPFLRRLLANNIDKLTDPGKALYSCMLNEAGGVVDDLIAYHFSATRYRLVVNASTADQDLAWMQKQSAGAAINIMPRRDLAMLALQGPNARARLWQVVDGSQAASEALRPFFGIEFGDYFIARTGYTGEDGFEVSLPGAASVALWTQLTEAGVKPAGLGARDTLRLEAGMNLYGNDMDETVSPLDAGLGWTVDLNSGRDFVGKTALLSNGAQHEFLGLLLLDRGVLRDHQIVQTARGRGEITSGGFSPTLNQSIAFARLPKGTAAGEETEVSVRDKWLKAKVTKLPFVRHGKRLV